MIKLPEKKLIVISLITIIILCGCGYFGYRYYLQIQNNISSEKQISALKKYFDDERARLLLSKSENQNLTNSLNAEHDQVSILSDKVGAISSTVGTLQKLSQTDKELLQKYSRVYFLNENYIPSNLTEIDPKYISQKNTKIQIHANVYPFLVRLIEAAANDNVNLQIISGYRSFYAQASLKTSYKVVYGSGSNQFSADQGYSEHQLGTAVDFTTEKLSVNFNSFASSDGYKWLTENAYKYGFVLSYPKGNKYYVFEPWHWRFVGVLLATKLHDENKYFYDLDQREIDQYLVNIFD